MCIHILIWKKNSSAFNFLPLPIMKVLKESVLKNAMQLHKGGQTNKGLTAVVSQYNPETYLVFLEC